MNAYNDAFTLWSLASALAVLLLGIVTVQGGRSRPRGALAFSLFAVLWGAQIVVGIFANLSPDAASAYVRHLLLVALVIPLPYFLAEFAVSQSLAPRSALAFAARGAFAVVAMAGAFVLVADPALLLEGIATEDGGHYPVWGSLHMVLAAGPFFLSLGLTLLALAHAKAAAPTPRLARRLAILLAGLGVFVAFTSANNLAYAAAVGDSLGLTLVLGGLAATCALVGARLLAAGLRERDRGDVLVGLAVLVPLAWGLVEGVLTTTVAPYLNTVGVWRLAGVAIIAYGIARWRIYDMPERLSRLAPRGVGTVAAAAVALLAFGTLQIFLEGPVPAVAAFAVFGASLLPSFRFAEKLLRFRDRRTKEDVEQALYGQRIDAYRAALEAALARGTLDEDAEFLAALRERWGISEGEHRVLLHYARTSVLVPRDGGAADTFERLRLLGEGGAGRTWLARDRARDRLVVLKEPLERWQKDPVVREMVVREARLAAKVQHPNVVKVEALVEHGKAPVMIMEYVDGGTLADALRARGTLPMGQSVRVAIDVLRGLEAVHTMGVVHRDVKPSNILLTSEGVAKVSDFGISMPANAGRTMLEASGTTRAGTWNYMAPEVRDGRTAGDRRSDVWSLAAVLHECIYGSPPSPEAVTLDRADVPSALSEALWRGLAPRPEDRYPTARAFAEALSKVVS